MGKHTGGEWSYADDNGENPRIVSTEIDPGTGKPCVLVDLTCAMRAVGDDPTGETQANGRVMAASSAMLAALDGLVNNGFTDDELARRWSWSVDAIRRARAAFAKAEG